MRWPVRRISPLASRVRKSGKVIGELLGSVWAHTGLYLLPEASATDILCSARHRQLRLAGWPPVNVGIEEEGVELMRDGFGMAVELPQGKTALQMQRGVPGVQTQ